MKLNKKQYEACIQNLGLLEGEEVRLHYHCYRREKYYSYTLGSKQEKPYLGLLVFTNDNMIFMDVVKHGVFSRNYSASQSIRVPLEQITGLSTGGTMIKHLKVHTADQEFKFEYVWREGKRTPIHDVVSEIQDLLKKARDEKKKVAEQVLAGTLAPKFVYCKYCGAKNKADASLCVNCNALLD